MIDETGTPNPGTPETPGTAEQAANPEAERTGFCQDCGRPLTQETMRQVGSGVFCDPCLARRAGTGPVPPGYAAGSGYVPPHVPRPALAGWLGLIPGVGAMYNGQFAKGIAHLLVFAILSTLSDHGNGIFGLLCFGWICYQSFEAYHTAKARLLGLPLPNPFGLNDIGERLGFTKNWQYGGQPYNGQAAGTQQGPPPAGTTTASDWSSSFAGAWTRSGGAWPFSQSQPQTPPQGPAQPPPPTQAASTSGWTGYVPPTAFGAAATPPPVVPTPDNWGSTPYHAAAPPAQAAYQVPYQAPYQAPQSAAPIPPAAYAVAPVVAPRSRRFPVGALWLIALGCLFLAINVGAHFELRGSWLVAVILAGVAAWSLTRNIAPLRHLPEASGRTRHIVCVLRFPVMLFVLAALFALQGANWFTLGQTWPVLLLALGGLLLLERVLGHADEPPPAPGFPGYAGAYAAEPVPVTPMPAAPGGRAEPVEPRDSTKGGE